MTILALIKFFKFIGFLGFSSSCFVLPLKEPNKKPTFFLRGIVLSFLLLWGCGFLLLKALGYQLNQAWVLLSMLTSLVSLAASFHLATHTPNRETKIILHSSLLATIAFMCFRPLGFTNIVSVILLGYLLMVGCLVYKSSSQEKNTEAILKTTLRLAMFEGFSLILLLLISMPIRKIFGISIDNRTGLIGWIHGALVMMYLTVSIQALYYRVLNWKQWSIGFLSTLLPFGFLGFERIMKKNSCPPIPKNQTCSHLA